ncbi:MAG: dihydrolipoyl dehydrogenase family protein [Planctomycetota bacterium]|jgi:pyruvate/2-oxoglutarate dehydrogenase complex dihydrolipoamide dehydrogenase (E3) component
MKTYDVLVLGGGTAGTAAAKAAHQAGAKVLMFNKGELGGLCILRGCMPTKTMLHAAHLVHEAAHHHTPGVGRSRPEIDFPAVMANKDAKVKRFQNAKIQGIEQAGYEVVDARARFTGADTVEADGETYRFTKGAVLATGSVPRLPPLHGIDSVPVWTSDDVMELKSPPVSAIVLGSGAIGMELAQFLARMGTAVTQVSRRRLFCDVDPLISDQMVEVLAAEPNLELVSPCQPQGLRKTAGGVALDLRTDAGPRTIEAAHFVAATGRDADLRGLGLEAAGIQVEGRRVVHGTDMRTTNDKVFVAGDASGSRLLLHVANWEGEVAGLGAARVEGEHRVEQRLHMTVVFTDPPLATIGMTEKQAREQGIDVITAHAFFPETGRAITMDVQHGVWKVVARKDTGEILGSQILGPRADDISHTIAAVMYYHGTAADLLKMPWYHPTVTEVLLSLARELNTQV